MLKKSYKNITISTNFLQTSNNEHDWTPIKYRNVLYHNRPQKQYKSSQDKFILRNCKNIANLI